MCVFETLIKSYLIFHSHPKMRAKVLELEEAMADQEPLGKIYFQFRIMLNNNYVVANVPSPCKHYEIDDNINFKFILPSSGTAP